MIKYLLLFLTAAGISLLLTPLIRSFAIWARVFDLPGERKVHQQPVPLLGGIAIFLSFNLTVILAVILNNSFINEPLLSKWWNPLLICQIVILGLGYFDDRMNLGPGIKFLFQTFVGILIALFGFGISNITNPFTGTNVHLGLFSVPVTIIWVVMITNALNLVDGLDGLAAGTSLIVSITIFGISFFNQNIGTAILSIILAGSILGFLRYNFYPAKIFLGDSGSLLLGFLLAVLSIQSSSKGATLVAVLAPILALGLPIMETLLSMIRRFLRSFHVVDYPGKNGHFRALFFKHFSVFKADKDHMHHRLLKLGFSERKAVLLLYGICIGLSALAFLSVAVKDLNFVAFIGAILVAFFIGARTLKYQEFRILENGLLIPIFSFPIINKRLFQAFLDLALISFSAYLCFILVFRGFGTQAKDLFIHSLPILLLSKIIILYLSGLYKGSWTYSSLEEILNIFGAILLSSLGALFVFSFVFGIDAFGGLIFFVLDFYLMLTLVGGFRFSYRIVSSYYERGFANKGKKVLIYGAGRGGSTVLKEIRHNGNYLFTPIGFIDDDPSKRGRVMHGCPIFGPLEQLENILGKNEISEIIISTGKIGRDKIRKLTEFCKQKGIIVRQFEFRFYEFP